MIPFDLPELVVLIRQVMRSRYLANGYTINAKNAFLDIFQRHGRLTT